MWDELARALCWVIYWAYYHGHGPTDAPRAAEVYDFAGGHQFRGER